MLYSQNFVISTKGFCDVKDITPQVGEIIRKSKIKDGLLTVFIGGATAGITTIEFEEGLVKDTQELMERLAPQNKKYHHNLRWQDNNGFSHLRASLIGPSLTIPLNKGKLELGTWQQIVVIDFDNKARERKIIVQILGA